MTDTSESGASESRKLTFADANAIAELLVAAQANRRIARLGPAGEAIHATARAFTAEAGRLAGAEDVRDLFLQVRLADGREQFWPVRELIDELLIGELAVFFDLPEGTS